jgi:hypothetical protein
MCVCLICGHAILRVSAALQPPHNPIRPYRCSIESRPKPTAPGALEELWKARPDAGLDDLDAAGGAGADGGAGGGAAELTPVALKYDDAAQYQVGGGRLWLR